MLEDNDNGFYSTGWIFLFLLAAGLMIYLVAVMPLRIIFKNSQKSFADAIMPYSNILDARSIMSLIIYSATALMWGMVVGQCYHATVDVGFLTGFICCAIGATFLSIGMALLDVREAATTE